jgi:hypothetical protein
VNPVVGDAGLLSDHGDAVLATSVQLAEALTEAMPDHSVAENENGPTVGEGSVHGDLGVA